MEAGVRIKCQNQAPPEAEDVRDDLWRCLVVVTRRLKLKQTSAFGFILVLTVKMWGSAGHIIAC